MPASSTGLAHWSPSDELELPRSTVGDLLRRAADEVPDRVALVDGCGEVSDGDRRRWTYAELLAVVEPLAIALLERLRPR